jgi:hypothetical protein
MFTIVSRKPRHWHDSAVLFYGSSVRLIETPDISTY